MKTVFVVCGEEPYESGAILRAFHSKENAEAFAAESRSSADARWTFYDVCEVEMADEEGRQP